MAENDPSASDDSDVALLDAWRAGDQRAGSALLRRYAPSLYRFFSGKVDDEIEDMIQRTMLALVRHKDGIREGSSFRAYLYTVARNEFYRYLRTRRRRRDPLDFGTVSLADLGTSPSGFVARQKEHELMLAALHRLPVELQLTLELFYWEELSTAELAAALEVAHGTAKSKLRRARTLLRRELDTLAAGSEQKLEATLGQLGAARRRG